MRNLSTAEKFVSRVLVISKEKDGQVMFKKILVAYDGSEGSKIAVKKAAEVAAKFGAEVTLLTIGGPPTPVTTLTLPGLAIAIVSVVELSVSNMRPDEAPHVRKLVLVVLP